MWNKTVHNTEPDGELSSYALNEGEIAGLLIGSVFLLFLVLPVTLAYMLACCKRFHMYWKSRNCRDSVQHFGDSIDPNYDQGAINGNSADLFPNAELMQSESPPSYTTVVNTSNSSGDALFPPEYDSALTMEKV